MIENIGYPISHKINFLLTDNVHKVVVDIIHYRLWWEIFELMVNGIGSYTCEQLSWKIKENLYA